jgi:hypothetical protein
LTIKKAAQRVGSVEDPWADVEQERTRLTAAMQRGLRK